MEGFFNSNRRRFIQIIGPLLGSPKLRQAMRKLTARRERQVSGDHFSVPTGRSWPDRDGRGVRTRGRFVAVIANADASRGAGELCGPVHRLRSSRVNWEESGGGGESVGGRGRAAHPRTALPAERFLWGRPA